MSIAKISILAGASVITAGSTAAVATRDKWWPNKSEKTVAVSVPSPDGQLQDQESSDEQECVKKEGVSNEETCEKNR